MVPPPMLVRHELVDRRIRRRSPNKMSQSRHLCLPLIRPIGSRRSAELFVMEPTYA